MQSDRFRPTSHQPGAAPEFELNPNPSTKNFILFAFKLLSINDSVNTLVWINNAPNSSFGVRPVVLLAQKECIEIVIYIMEKIINPEVHKIEKERLTFSEGIVKTKYLGVCLMGKCLAY